MINVFISYFICVTPSVRQHCHRPAVLAQLQLHIRPAIRVQPKHQRRPGKAITTLCFLSRNHRLDYYLEVGSNAIDGPTCMSEYILIVRSIQWI